MAVEVFNFEQGTPEWYEARRGIPTASMFDVIVKQDGTARKSQQRTTYMNELAGEIITEAPAPSFTSKATDGGHEMEPEARELYTFITGQTVEQVGFIRNGDVGYSPDGLIGEKGALEIKLKAPKFSVGLIASDEFPADHKAQCQGGLLVSEREWIDIAVYWPNLPLFRKRAYRDEKYLSNLEAALVEFNTELAELVEKVRAYGMAA
ncbi:lambda exonuclease family protein [Roseibium sp.]|uniref:lambda exonuclease family protein n=1 Tax=Roseibium sp. TaxID=1936156 RepID=UPI003B5298E5